jgi:hypothetical protein
VKRVCREISLDKNHFSQVDNDCMGIMIGPKGANVRKVQAMEGAIDAFALARSYGHTAHVRNYRLHVIAGHDAFTHMSPIYCMYSRFFLVHFPPICDVLLSTIQQHRAM